VALWCNRHVTEQQVFGKIINSPGEAYGIVYDRGVRRRRRTLNEVNVLAGARVVLGTSEIAISEEVYRAMVVLCTNAVNDGGRRENNYIGIRQDS